jgi:cell division protein FtsZ
MAHSGRAHMGVGSATGKDKAEIAARAAIASPLQETSIKGATGIVISFSASPDIGLEDVHVAASMIAEECNPDANIIWGVAFDPELDDELRITLLATGFDKKPGDDAEDDATELEADGGDSAEADSTKKAAPKKKAFASGEFDLDDFFNDSLIK